MTFAFKTKPYAHQLRAYNASRDAPAFALFMEQRTGKTKVILDTAAYQYDKGAIKTLIVIAFPNGVHRNWIDDEAPTHMAAPYSPVLWRAGASGGKRWLSDFQEKLKSDSLLLLSINIESTITESCKAVIKAAIKRGPFMCCYDESTSIGTPGVARTKVAMNIGKYAAMRRLATGTPADQGPLKLWSQFMFLDPAILGHKNFFTFKHHYAVWEKGYNAQTETEYDELKGYKNLDELTARIKPYSFRVTKDECFDLPPKVYQKRYFDLSKEQMKLYTQLVEEYRLELKALGTVTAAHVLTRLMRLQQVACGYVPIDAGAEVCPACNGEDEGCTKCRGLGYVGAERVIYNTKRNPRLEALEDELSRVKGQSIIWARFNQDVDLIMALLARMGRRPVRYDGQVPEKQRAANKVAYQNGNATDFVGKARAAGRGLELAANTTDVFYYTNEYSLELRRQSEDRCHGPKTKNHINYTDFIASGTVDEDVVQILRDRRNLADLIHGDPTAAWI